MPRPALKPGEWGNLRFQQGKNGQTLVDARLRDLDGKLRRFRIQGRDEYACVRRLEYYGGVKISTTRVVPADRPDLLTDTSLLAELLDCWMLMARASGRMSEDTADRTAAHIRNHIDAPLGRKPLNELRVQTLDRFLLAERVRSGASTARRTRSILVRALAMAVRYDLVPRNAAARTTPVQVPQRDPNALSIKDIGTLRLELQRWTAAASEDERTSREQLGNLVEVALGTGLRLGELLALRPSSVDLTTRKVLVAATCTYSRARGFHISESPKRARQRRVIPVSGVAADALERALLEHPGDDSTIFSGRTGGLLRPNAARDELHRFLRTANAWASPLESVAANEVSFQLLRRTVATHLARHSMIDDARDQLGHASISITERAYVQRIPQVDPLIGEVLEALFAPTPRS